MQVKSLRFGILLILLFNLGASGQAQNIEGGMHVGLAILGDETPLGSETGGEYGVWFALWPAERVAIAADWSYASRDSFQTTIDGDPVGESERNRQYVDITLQYHIPVHERWTFFVEGGGGAHWNNRHVSNPMGNPGFAEDGKESTRQGVWTVGSGFRCKIAPHLNWIGELKLHNLGQDERDGLRLITGLTVSWR